MALLFLLAAAAPLAAAPCSRNFIPFWHSFIRSPAFQCSHVAHALTFTHLVDGDPDPVRRRETRNAADKPDPLVSLPDRYTIAFRGFRDGRCRVTITKADTDWQTRYSFIPRHRSWTLVGIDDQTL